MATSLRTEMLDVPHETRGRPSGPWHSVSDRVSFTYLVRISRKYEIETPKLLECIQNARTRGESFFNDLSIRRRQMTLENMIFLITQGGKIIAQVKLTTKLLDYLAKTDINRLRFGDYAVTKRSAPGSENLEIKDLNSRSKRFNLEVKVTEKSTPKIIPSMWGKELLLSTATIADRSGTIKLPLWNDQIDMVSVGDTLHIENAGLKRFRGELQVRIGKFTRLRKLEKEGR